MALNLPVQTKYQYSYWYQDTSILFQYEIIIVLFGEVQGTDPVQCLCMKLRQPVVLVLCRRQWVHLFFEGTPGWKRMWHCFPVHDGLSVCSASRWNHFSRFWLSGVNRRQPVTVDIKPVMIKVHGPYFVKLSWVGSVNKVLALMLVRPGREALQAIRIGKSIKQQYNIFQQVFYFFPVLLPGNKLPANWSWRRSVHYHVWNGRSIPRWAYFSVFTDADLAGSPVTKCCCRISSSRFDFPVRWWSAAPADVLHRVPDRFQLHPVRRSSRYCFHIIHQAVVRHMPLPHFVINNILGLAQPLVVCHTRRKIIVQVLGGQCLMNDE